MFERLEVRNYQSIETLDLELGAFTVIVGPSGRGKSAFMRALTALCFNQVGAEFIRHGQSRATVGLTFDGGRVVEWSKPRDKGATYVLDGQEHTRVGRAVPQEVEDALRVRRIEVDKGISWRPQFHLQHDQPLLLTEAPTLAARALAKLTKLQVLVEAQVACRRDKQRAERQSASAQEEVERLRGQLAGLPNVKRVRGSMDRASKLLRSVSKGLDTAQSAQGIVGDIAGSMLLADIALPPQEDVEALGERLSALEKSVDGTAKLGRAKSALDAVGAASAEAADAVERLQAEHDALVEKLGACPLCGSTETWGQKHGKKTGARRRRV